MDISKLIDFIGHASSYPALDDFLIQNGFTTRLTAKDLPSAILVDIDKTLSLQFVSSYTENYGSPKSDGFLFLEDVTLYNENTLQDGKCFEGPIPFGLKLSMTPEEVEKLIGKPDMAFDFAGAHMLKYDNLLPEKRVLVKYTKDKSKMQFIRFLPLVQK